MPFHVALAHVGERGRFVAVDGDEELLGVEAVHLDEPVGVRDGAVDDDEDEVVVVVELGTLAELLGVLDRERVELEDLAQDREVVLIGPVDIDPEERAPGEQPLDVLATEAHLLAAAVVNDHAAVRRRTPRFGLGVLRASGQRVACNRAGEFRARHLRGGYRCRPDACDAIGSRLPPTPRRPR